MDSNLILAPLDPSSTVSFTTTCSCIAADAAAAVVVGNVDDIGFVIVVFVAINNHFAYI